MKRKAFTLTAGLVLVAGSADRELQGSTGSTRKVVTCNVDGSYTCANEPCGGRFCCEVLQS